MLTSWPSNEVREAYSQCVRRAEGYSVVARGLDVRAPGDPKTPGQPILGQRCLVSHCVGQQVVGSRSRTMLNAPLSTAVHR